MTTIAHEIELEPLTQALTSEQSALGSALPFLGSVKVRLSVRIGGAEITVAELLKLEQGAVLPLDRSLDDPLDVMIDDKVVARGVLVAVGEHFGVRITETAIAGS